MWSCFSDQIFKFAVDLDNFCHHLRLAEMSLVYFLTVLQHISDPAAELESPADGVFHRHSLPGNCPCLGLFEATYFNGLYIQWQWRQYWLLKRALHHGLLQPKRKAALFWECSLFIQNPDVRQEDQ